MKVTFALLAAVAAVMVVATAPALATNGPHGTTFITDTLGGNGHPANAEPYSSLGSRIRAGDRTGGALNIVAPQAASQSQGYRFITDTLAPGGGTSLSTASKISFSWSDASVGAATAIGALLALIGALLLMSRRRSSLVI